MSTAPIDLSILDSMTDEQREAFYLRLREERQAAGIKDPRTPRKTSSAGGVVQVVARANDNARATLANERTVTRLAETWDNWRTALVTYANATQLNIPPAEEYDTAEAHVQAILPLLPDDLRERLETSRTSAREKMAAAQEKIANKLKGRNTVAEGRAKRSKANGSEE